MIFKLSLVATMVVIIKFIIVSSSKVIGQRKVCEEICDKLKNCYLFGQTTNFVPINLYFFAVCYMCKRYERCWLK
ncbi:hypothetical protein DPQ25_00485 [Hydrogeniiclostridium mannosilyticum]|uniref:Uncharacterized protein n=1 Tax=Hydrogeniiclostridium mannosilyticum TaxID=2764322 RepID=A0A328UM85_9FIRM|nr:hypothetical protein DPQ25_00485 [Hydrogeniiclostridium mannosilyticum]